MKRKDTREEAVKIVYSMDINKDYDKSLITRHLEHFEVEDCDLEYLHRTICNMIDNLEAIDNHVIDNSKGWKITRISKVDLAILRIALAEILFDDSIPSSVSINEAVEISKKYSNDDSHKFINGILGTVVRELGQ